MNDPFAHPYEKQQVNTQGWYANFKRILARKLEAAAFIPQTCRNAIQEEVQRQLDDMLPQLQPKESLVRIAAFLMMVRGDTIRNLELNASISEGFGDLLLESME